MLSDALRDRIQKLIDENEVLVFMKGTRHLPQCGFSAQVVQILDEFLPEYGTVNVLADAELRQGIKEFSDWPTIPQVYVKGEFIGGCDIVRDMFQSGELSKVLGTGPVEVKAPSITLTDSAVAAFREAAKDAEYEHLRLEISPQFQHGLSFGPRLQGDLEVESNGFTLLMDRGSARRAEGLKIDFVEGPDATGFKIDNPNEPPRVKQMSVRELKQKLDAKEELWLFDVRGEDERAVAKIDEAIPLDEEGQKKLASLDKDAMVVFQCRSGRRSQAAAEHYLQQGYRNVWNLAGGILAWADEIDPSLPRS